MSDPRPSAPHEDSAHQGADRKPWQELGFEKIAASDAESGASGSFDGTSYS